MKIKTNFRELDERLGGGIPCGHITELCGAHATWKSTICFRLIQSFVNGEIDMERSTTSAPAIRNLDPDVTLCDTQQDITRALDSTLSDRIATVTDITTVEDLIIFVAKKTRGDSKKEIINKQSVESGPELLIIDSLPSLCEHYETSLIQSIQLHKLNLVLQRFAYRNNAAIVVVNYTLKGNTLNPQGRAIRMLGRAWYSAPSMILHLVRAKEQCDCVYASFLKGDPAHCSILAHTTGGIPRIIERPDPVTLRLERADTY